MQNEEKPVKYNKRRIARFLAIQYFFTVNYSQTNDLPLNVFETQSLLSIIEEKDLDSGLYESIIEGVSNSQEEIDEFIREFAPAWPIDQINPVDLMILRCAIWEGFVGKITPPKVVINEAIDITKLLSSDKSSKFINGVLGKLLLKEDNE